MDWFYAKNGQQNGPVEKEQLEALFLSGEITSSDLVWNDSMSDWAPIGTLPEFSAADAGQPPAESAPPASTTPPASTGAASTGAASTAAASAGPAATSTHLSPAPHNGEQIPSYLWQSIVAIIFCCLPAAVVSLVYAVRVGPAVEAGDLARAQEASKNAKMWFWIAFGLGIVANTIIFGLSFIGALAE